MQMYRNVKRCWLALYEVSELSEGPYTTDVLMVVIYSGLARYAPASYLQKLLVPERELRSRDRGII